MTAQEPVVLGRSPATRVRFDHDRSSWPSPAPGVNTDVLERMRTTAGPIFRNDGTARAGFDPSLLLALLTAHIAHCSPVSMVAVVAPAWWAASIARASMASAAADGFPGVTGTQGWYLMTVRRAVLEGYGVCTAPCATFPARCASPLGVGPIYGRYGGPLYS